MIHFGSHILSVGSPSKPRLAGNASLGSCFTGASGEGLRGKPYTSCFCWFSLSLSLSLSLSRCFAVESHLFLSLSLSLSLSPEFCLLFLSGYGAGHAKFTCTTSALPALRSSGLPCSHYPIRLSFGALDCLRTRRLPSKTCTQLDFLTDLEYGACHAKSLPGSRKSRPGPVSP